MLPPPITVPAWRTTVFFRDPGSGLSWSEVYWAPPGESTDAAFNVSVSMVNARTNLNHPSIRTMAVRVSDEHIQRDAYLVTPGEGNAFQPTSDLGTDALNLAEMPYSTVMVRQESGSLYHAQRYVSGIYDATITDPPGPNLAGAGFLRNFQAWRNALLGIGRSKLASPAWQMLVLSKNPADTVSQPIMNVANIPLGGVLYTVSVPLVSVAVGDIVRIRGAKWIGNVNGNLSFMVISVNNAAGTITIQSDVAGLVWSSGGTIYRQRRILTQLSDVTIRGETHRKRGGRFFTPLGRTKRRK